MSRFAFAIRAFSSVLLLSACGGQSAALPGVADGGDTGTCLESDCPPTSVWNPASCRCESLDAAAPVADSTAACPAIFCPTGSVQGFVGDLCACVPIDASIVVDSTLRADAPAEVSHLDSSRLDSTSYASDREGPDEGTDVIYAYDASDVYYGYDTGPLYCDPTQCGPGFVAIANNPGPFSYCQCVACANDCPSGQTPMAGCGGCTACSYACPPGFVYGNGCNCGPPGTDAGPNSADSGFNGPDAGGTTCLLQGYSTCSSGSWCQLGTCPDGTTQYGCYCNADGTADCSVVCPPPPPCSIPGQGLCPYGSQCIYGDCEADASSPALVCSCNSGGSASCYTSSCANVPMDGGVDAGDVGVTCLLEGYQTCSAGSWCQLGICPDNATPYGCTCNADGTASCRLTCPNAGCTIPGEGTCPANTSCTFGTCSGSRGTKLNCYCSTGGSAYCNTISCAEAGGGD